MKPCQIDHAKNNKIREAITSLIKSEGLKDLDSVVKRAKEINSKITKEDIVQALAVGSQKSEAIKQRIEFLQDKKEFLKGIEKDVDNFKKLVDSTVKPGLDPVEADDALALKAVAIIRQLRDYATAIQFSDLSDKDYAEITLMLSNADGLAQALASVENDSQIKERIDRILEGIQKSREKLKIDNLEKSLEKTKQELRDLRSDNPDLTFINKINDTAFLKRRNATLNNLQRQLDSLRKQVDEEQRILAREKRVETGLNFLGMNFNGSAATNLKRFLLIVKEEGWEAPRAIQFMMDMSALMLQLGSFTLPTVMMANVNYRKLSTGDFQGAFVNQRALAKAFWESGWGVIKQEKDLKGTSGTFTEDQFQTLANHRHYALAEAGGLKLSKAKSITSSEEFWTSRLANRIPVVGLIKDLSEDSMVVMLNQIRMHTFSLMVDQNPNADFAEIKMMAESVNKLTGTTNKAGEITRGLRYVMSAPALALSKLQAAVDLPRLLAKTIVTGGKGMKKSELLYLRALAQNMGAFIALSSALSLLGFDTCLDPRESCFLRIQGDNTSMDITGGLGTMYRMLADVIIIANGGPGESASEEAKERWKYLLNQKKVGFIDPVLKTLVRYRLHPTINSTAQVLTGKNFFNKNFETDFLGLSADDPIESRAQAAIRNLLPIFLQTGIEELQAMMNGTSSDIDDQIIRVAGQFLGINSFEYSNESVNPKHLTYFSSIGYNPYNSVKYPKEIKNVRNPDGTVNKRKQEVLKAKYKKEYGDLVGEIAEERPTKIIFDLRRSQKASELNREFIKKYKLK